MQKTFSFPDWLDYLRRLMPISGLVHVGAGAGMDSVRYAKWSVPRAALIEADDALANKLAVAIKDYPTWSSHTAFLGDKEGESTFYLASHANESGALKPEDLGRIWRNLRTVEERALRTSTLDAMLGELDTTEPINWGVIDCLPALPVLRGADGFLAQADIIVARVVLDETLLADQGCGKSEVDRFLETCGYRCVASEEEHQPALGRAVYLRDWKALFATTCATQRKLAFDQEAQIKQHSQAHDELSKLATDRLVQVEKLSQACEEQSKRVADAHTQVAQLTQARDEQAKLAADRQAQVQKLAQVRDEQTRQVADAHAQVQQLTQARDAQSKLAAERQTQIEALTHARDEQAKLVTEQQRQLDEARLKLEQMEVQNSAFSTHQTLLQDELVRAEAQIDLIKDVLLREPGL